LNYFAGFLHSIQYREFLIFSDQWQWLLSVLSVHLSGELLFFFPPYIYISAASSLFVVAVVAHFLQVFVVCRFGEENAGYKIYAKLYLLTAPSSLLLFEKVLETPPRRSLGYGCKWSCFFIFGLKGEPKKLELGFQLGFLGVLFFSCQIEGELKKLGTQVMRNCGLWV
jgi:hypothetical protein